MKAEDLLDAVGGVDEKLIKESEALAEAGPNKRRRIKTWMKAAAAAACLGLVLFAASRFSQKSQPLNTSEPSSETEPEPTAVLSEESLQDKITALMNSDGNERFEAAAQRITLLPVEGRVCWYNCRLYRWIPESVSEPTRQMDFYNEDSGRPTQPSVPAVDIDARNLALNEKLAKMKGEEFLVIEADSRMIGRELVRFEEQHWYCPAGAKDLKYLILEEPEGWLSLWEFGSFLTSEEPLLSNGLENGIDFRWYYPDADYSPMTYGEVYRLIYGVNGADDIVSLTAEAALLGGTQENQAVKEQIGMQSIMDPLQIARFWSCVKDTEYNKTDRQTRLFTYSFSAGDTDWNPASNDPIWGGRYLTIVLTSGTVIDSLKYDALRGAFYEWGGIGSALLNDSQVAALNEIFGIR